MEEVVPEVSPEVCHKFSFVSSDCLFHIKFLSKFRNTAIIIISD